MQNFISQDYFSKLEELFSSALAAPLSNKASEMRALLNLIHALPLNTDLDESEFKECLTRLNGNKSFTSYKDTILFLSKKNENKKNIDWNSLYKDIKNYSAFYFLPIEKGNEFSLNNGIVCKGLDYDGATFFDNCTVTSEPIADTWEPVENSVPPVNAMLIIDNYIFSNPFEKKIQSLIEFIKLYKGNLQIPFHLTVLFSINQGNPNLIKKAFRLLSEIGNIEIQLLADHNLPSPDRLIYTNYTSGDIGHPFDGRETRFSQNFLGHDNKVERIRNNYINYKKDLIKWNSVIKKNPGNFGIIQSKWETSIFTNRLFIPIINN